MCLLVVLHRVAAAPLVVAANRDELLTRPSEAMTVLSSEAPRVIGGRDLLAGGTWMAINEHGVVAALTNTPSAARDPTLRSRGELPVLLARSETAADAVDALAKPVASRRYGPCWLLVADRTSLYYVDLSSVGRPRPPVALDPGVWVLENRPLDAPSRKADRVRALLGDPEGLDEAGLTTALEALLADRVVPEGEPPTSALCVDTPIYGTRSANVVVVGPGGGEPSCRFSDGPPGTVAWRTASWPLRARASR